jgi:hypothetical protein
MSDRPRAERDPERPDPVEVDPDAPPTAEELAAAERLRDALEQAPHDSSSDDGHGDLDLVASLRSAWAPDALDTAAQAELVDLATASSEERELAAVLRDRLDGDEVVAVLRAAWHPAALDPSEHQRIVTTAVAAETKRETAKVVPLRPRTMRLAVVTTTTVLAFAASVVVWITSASQAELPLARARSTQPLFDEPFKAGETSARIDRIAVARAADYRDNRFAKWGVR